MSLEGIIAGIGLKRKKDFLTDVRGLKYQLKAEQENGSIIKIATRGENMFIVVEKDGSSKIAAGFIFNEKDDVLFQTYSNGGFQQPFGKSRDFLVYKRNDSLFAVNQIDGKQVSVKFFEDTDKELKYEHHSEHVSGIGLL